MSTAALSAHQARLMVKPGQACFRAVADASRPTVDLAAGIINGVSLITADREATGWFMWVDAKTVAMFAALLEGRKLKGYATHGDWCADGTLDEVGLWLNSRIEGLPADAKQSAGQTPGSQQGTTVHLRADFNALTAWRKHDEDEFDTLFELADKAPDEFGASLRFAYTLAWVRTTGEDVPTSICGWNCEDDCPMFEPSAPADALRSDFPSVRPVKVMSADFVDEPAANDGLFRALPAAPVDAPAKVISPVFTMDIKTLQAEFGKNPAHLSRAVALFSANEKLTVAELRATITNEEQTAELSTLRNEHGGFKGELAKIETAGFKAANGKTGVDVLLSEHASFSKANAEMIKTESADIAALKAAGFEAKDGKSALVLALAALAKAKADIATLREGGTVAIETGSGGSDDSKPNTAGLTGVRRAAAAFNAQFKAGKN